MGGYIRQSLINLKKIYERKIPGMLLHCHTLAAGDSESPSLEAIHNLFGFQKAS